jgi:Ni/Co efflux regulator RcnB
MKRITLLAAAGALVATPALGAWTAFATTGDDAPAAHVRLAGDRRGEPEPGDDHGRHHHRHGADDGRHHHRHGAEDPAGHVRHSLEPEPGDDRGVHREAEPGDDRGGHHGGDDGGHHGSGQR